MGNCISASKRVHYTRKPASVIGSIGHLGSAIRPEDHLLTEPGHAQASIVSDDTQRLDERRGSMTPSIARSLEADGAVIQGYAEPHSFRILRRQNDQSSLEALEKAFRDDPIMKSAKIRIEGAPSRRPTALGAPAMQ